MVEIQCYAGWLTSEREPHKGMSTPACLFAVLADGRTHCRLIFLDEAREPILLKGVVEGTDLDTAGTWPDPRGWDVEWHVGPTADGMSGECRQPHDFGRIELRRID